MLAERVQGSFRCIQPFSPAAPRPPFPITFVTAATWAEQRAQLDAARARLCRGRRLRAEGRPAPAAAGGRTARSPASCSASKPPTIRSRTPSGRARWPTLLPAGAYRFANAPHDARLAALAFALGSYRFTRYRKADGKDVQLELPEGVDGDDLTRIVEGVFLARDLINTPANDMGPPELEYAARALATAARRQRAT